ncbi:MAG: hypothetical protein WA971_11150, partial [Microbacterium sp.]
SSLMYVLVRQGDLEAVPALAERALGYLHGDDLAAPDDTTGSAVSSLMTVRDALRLAPLDPTEQELLAGVEALLRDHPVQPASVPATPLAHSIDRHHDVIRRCTLLAEVEQWSDAADLVLVAANRAAETQILLSEAVDAVLDVALLFIQSLVLRPHELPRDSWRSAGIRLAEWLRENGDALSASQRARSAIFVPIAEFDLDELDRVVAAQGEQENTDQIAAWLAAGDLVSRMLRATLRFQDLFGDVPEASGIAVHRTIDGGVAINRWLAVHEGEPMLLFSTSSSSSFGTGARDPLVGLLVSDGFPDGLSSDGAPRRAEGWRVRVDDGRLTLRSPGGLVIVDVEEDEENRGWFAMVSRARVLRVIYGDPADRRLDEVIAGPVQALVTVEGRSRAGGWWGALLRRFPGRRWRG